MMTDPIGDMLARIRNAGGARHAQMSCPSSKLKLAVAKVLSDEGFVGEVSSDGDEKMARAVFGSVYQAWISIFTREYSVLSERRSRTSFGRAATRPWM